MKTVPSDGDIEVFIASVGDESRRQDCRLAVNMMQMMRRIAGEQPVGGAAAAGR